MKKLQIIFIQKFKYKLYSQLISNIFTKYVRAFLILFIQNVQRGKTKWTNRVETNTSRHHV